MKKCKIFKSANKNEFLDYHNRSKKKKKKQRASTALKQAGKEKSGEIIWSKEKNEKN